MMSLVHETGATVVTTKYVRCIFVPKRRDEVQQPYLPSAPSNHYNSSATLASRYAGGMSTNNVFSLYDEENQVQNELLGENRRA